MSSGLPASNAFAALTTRQLSFNEDWAGFLQGFYGLAQVNFTVPPIPDTLRPCAGAYNVALSLIIQTANTVNFCVAQ